MIGAQITNHTLQINNIKKTISLIIIIGLNLLLVGCAADSGNTKLAKTSNEQINSTFEKGKTTQAEVKASFGEPDDTDIMGDGKIKWVYTHIKRSAMARNYIPVVNGFQLELTTLLKN